MRMLEEATVAIMTLLERLIVVAPACELSFL